MGSDEERRDGAQRGGDDPVTRPRDVSEILDEIEARYGKDPWLPPWLRAEGGR